MQGLEMLLYGTKNTLYDPSSKKWIVSSKGLTDSFNFLHTIFSEGLGPSPQQELDTQWGTKVSTQGLPQSKIAIDLDGSWQSGNWKKTGTKPQLCRYRSPTLYGPKAGKPSLILAEKSKALSAARALALINDRCLS